MKWDRHVVQGKLIRAVIIAGVLAHACMGAQSQAMRVRPTVRPRPMDSHPDSLTVTATPNLVNFTLVSGGMAQGSTPISITTIWSTHGSLPTLTLYGYFNSSNAALSDNLTPPDNIPSSAVLGQMSSGLPTTYTAFSQTNAGFGGAGSSLLLINSVQSRDDQRTDSLSLRIDLSNVPNLPAGNYTGYLTIQASIQ